jgi:hypothetical protein
MEWMEWEMVVAMMVAMGIGICLPLLAIIAIFTAAMIAGMSAGALLQIVELSSLKCVDYFTGRGVSWNGSVGDTVV